MTGNAQIAEERQKLGRRTRITSFFATGFMIFLGLCTFACETSRAAENLTHFLELSMRSASTPMNMYAVDSLAFADVNGDRIEDFIFHEKTRTYPKNTLLRLAHIVAGDIEVMWSAPFKLRTGRGERFLVGNVDDDLESELVVFSGRRLIRDTIFGTRVFNWRGNELTTFGTDQLPATAGALLDIDGDGVKEVVFAVVPKRFHNWEGREPAILTICRVTSQGFETIHELKLPHAVSSLSSADLDGDGIDEFFTEEMSRGGAVEGQIAIYAVDAATGIRRVYVANKKSVPGVQFFRAFESQGATYLLIVRFGASRAIGIYEPLLLSDGRYELVPQRTFDPRLMQDAVLSTMAYSRDLNRYVRRFRCSEEEQERSGLPRCDKLEWIPAEVYR